MNMLLDTLKWSIIIGAAALALTLLKPLLDRRYSPRWRYGLWLAMAALLLTAPAQGVLLREAEAPLRAAVVIEVPQMELHVSREEGLALRRPAAPAPQAAPAIDQSVPSAPAPGRTWDLDMLLPGLWLLGIAAFTLYHLGGTLAFLRRARRWSRPAGTETAALYEAVRGELGLKKAPPLRVSAAVDSPMVLGLLRPCLLLPGEDWGERELRFILRHELIHYRRRDLWYKLVMLSANAVHWFNPLVYLMTREASRDVELTCDALVVAGADPETRRAYSEALLSSIHRQKGLSRSALSTHFYGGAEVMKERFRNILGRSSRRWGAAALAVTLLVTVAAACAVGINQGEEPQALTEEELSQWQEKLNTAEWNGFLSRMYTDIRYLNPEDLFYSGAGISRPATEAEIAVLEAQQGAPIGLDVIAMDTADIDAYLAEHTGIAREDFAAGAWANPWDGKSWRDLAAGDTHFAVHGDSNFVAVAVTGGTKAGNTVTLTVEADQNVQPSFSNGLTAGTLTIADGKVRSFTTPLYSAGEEAALAFLDQEVQRLSGQGIEITDRFIDGLTGHAGYGFESAGIYAWSLTYYLRPGDMDQALALGTGGLTASNGWLTREGDGPLFFFRVDEDGTVTRIFDPPQEYMDYLQDNPDALYPQTSPGADGEPGAETGASSDAGGDGLIHQTGFTLTEGRTGTVSLYGQEREYGWGVSRVEVVWSGESAPACTLSVRDALLLTQPPELSDPGSYTEAWNADGGLVLEDMNFDGYADIGLQAATPAYNLPYLYWLYNPASGQYEFAFRLLVRPDEIDTENRRLVCSPKSGQIHYTEYYVYDENGQLYLAQRDTLEYGEMGSSVVRTESFEKPVYDWQGGSYAELTAAELGAFADYFNTVEHNGLLRFPYRSAEDLGPFLWVLLYDHSGGAADMTAEEAAAVEEAMDALLRLDARKLTRTYIKDYLAANYLIWEEADSLMERFGDTLGVYLPEYDAYYSQHGDTEMRQYDFKSGMRFSDGSVTLYYTADVWDYSGGDYSIAFDQELCVTLLSNGSGGWYVTSNYVNE